MAVIEQTRPETLKDSSEAMRPETELASDQIDQQLDQIFSNPDHHPVHPDVEVLRAEEYTPEECDPEFNTAYYKIGNRLGKKLDKQPPTTKTRHFSPIGENGEYGQFSIETLRTGRQVEEEGPIDVYDIVDTQVVKPSGESKRSLRINHFVKPPGEINGVSSTQTDLARTAA